jgi:hypothetical protein
MAKPATIDEALDAFLADQRKRLSAKTLRNYENVVSLLRSSLNGYAYQSLAGLEEKRWREAFDGGDEEAFTRLFGPEKIVENLGEFLGYFMVRNRCTREEHVRRVHVGLRDRALRVPGSRLHVDLQVPGRGGVRQ